MTAATKTSRAIGGIDAIAFCLLFGGLAAGCKAEAPDALRHLPTDADVVAGFDVGQLADWKGLGGRGPLAAYDLPEAFAGIAGCGIDLDATRVLVGAKADATVVVVTGPGIGDASNVECIGRADWRDATDPWFRVAEDGTFSIGDLTGKAMSDDLVILASGEYADQHDALRSQDAGPASESMSRLLAQVDHRAAAWLVTAPSVAPTGVLAAITGLRIGVQTGDDVKIDATVWTASDDDAQTLQTEGPERLAEIAKWIYASPTLVDGVELRQQGSTVDFELEIPRAQWQTLDARFVAERRQQPSEDAAEADVASLLADALPSVPARDEFAVEVALREAPPEAMASIGVPECDEFLQGYAKCIDEKMPEAVRETSHKALETSAEAWKQAAASPAGREGLAEACKTASEAVAPSCGW